MNHAPGNVIEAEELLSRAQVAHLFNVAPSTVTRWADEGKLVCIRTLGGHRRYQKESIIKLVYRLPKEASVETMIFEIPKMYGDHHTSAVHQALSHVPGIQEVWASAASREARVTFDPKVVQPQEIAARLAKAGYPTRNGQIAQTAGTHPKDPAWAKLGLRMTQTHPASA